MIGCACFMEMNQTEEKTFFPIKGKSPEIVLKMLSV